MSKGALHDMGWDFFKHVLNSPQSGNPATWAAPNATYCIKGKVKV